MKKILSFFAAMLVAVAVSATPVALPATLDVSNVSFRSEGMPDFVIEAGQDYAGTYFDMGAHDSANDTLLYAEWDVTIEPINYNVAVDVYNTNSWRVQLYVLNQAGDTVKALRYKGSSGQKGQYAIGSIDMRDLAAGNYKVRAHAATAWSAMKLKDVIFEADYQGVSVALPGELLPAYAELSANASVTNNAIAFKPSTANSEYATWNVSFAAAGSFNVSIDITATNGHNYGVALLSADGQTEIGAVSEGAQKSDTGEKELGAIAVPAAGNYKVKLTNATQWSEAVLNKITFAAPVEPQMKTIYCKMDKAWWKADGAAVGCYTWDDGGNAKAAWPGERMTPVEGEADLWSVELDINTYHMCIFTRMNPVDGDNQDWGAKTTNLTIPTDENDMFTITNDDPSWGDPGCTGAWSKYEPAAPVADEWVEIKFAEAATAAEIAEDASYTVPGTEFALVLHDAGDKMVIDANNSRFGTADDYTIYNYRIKSGGASSSTKNYFTLNIPEAGKLRLAPRTGSNSATDRALIIAQGETELYNAVVRESQAIKILEGADSVMIYPYVEVNVAAGEVRVSYSAGMNFYAFAFKAVEPEPELPYMAIIGDMNGWAGTELVPAEDKLTASATIHLDMNDNSGYGFKVLIGDKAYCIEPGEQWYSFNRGWTSASGIDHVATDEEAFWLSIDKAGDYTFTWTIAEKKLDITFPELLNITYYFVNTPDWEKVYAYAWDPENAAWPGEEATLQLGVSKNGHNVWAYTMPENLRHIIFNDGTSGDGHQTANLTVEDGKPYFNDGTWYATLNDVPTAIENTAVDAKAVKLIENGQMIIIRGNEKFNAQGQVIR